MKLTSGPNLVRIRSRNPQISEPTKWMSIRCHIPVNHPPDGATGAFYVKGLVTGYGGIGSSPEVLNETLELHRVDCPPSLVGPVDPSCAALSGRLKFTVRRHKFNKDSRVYTYHTRPDPDTPYSDLTKN